MDDLDDALDELNALHKDVADAIGDEDDFDPRGSSCSFAESFFV